MPSPCHWIRTGAIPHRQYLGNERGDYGRRESQVVDLHHAHKSKAEHLRCLKGHKRLQYRSTKQMSKTRSSHKVLESRSGQKYGRISGSCEERKSKSLAQIEFPPAMVHEMSTVKDGIRPRSISAVSQCLFNTDQYVCMRVLRQAQYTYSVWLIAPVVRYVPSRRLSRVEAYSRLTLHTSSRIWPPTEAAFLQEALDLTI